MRVALPAVVHDFGDYVILDEHLEWKKSIAFRGPSRLRVRRG